MSSSSTAKPATTVEQRIEDAYRELAKGDQDWVDLTKLRQKLTDLPRAQVDEALLRMQRHQSFYIAPNENQKELTAEDRAAAIRIGGRDKHMVAMDFEATPAKDTVAKHGSVGEASAASDVLEFRVVSPNKKGKAKVEYNGKTYDVEFHEGYNARVVVTDPVTGATATRDNAGGGGDLLINRGKMRSQAILAALREVAKGASKSLKGRERIQRRIGESMNAKDVYTGEGSVRPKRERLRRVVQRAHDCVEGSATSPPAVRTGRRTIHTGLRKQFEWMGTKDGFRANPIEMMAWMTKVSNFKAALVADSEDGGDQPDYSDGVMIALLVPEAVANTLALPGGTPAKEMHITLAYLGKTTEIQDSAQFVQDVLEVLTNVAPENERVEGQYNGVARFNTGTDKDAVVLTFDSPTITKLYMSIMDGLKDANVKAYNDHGFVPHTTVTYIPVSEPTPDIRPENPTKLSFDELFLVFGQSNIPIKLGNRVKAPALT